MRGPGKPILRFDPGLLFLLAGLAMLAAIVVLPAEQELRALQDQVQELEREGAHVSERLRAHSAFLDMLQADDPLFLERLAATQLNIVPEQTRPILLIRARNTSVRDWIEQSVEPHVEVAEAETDSVLTRLTRGASRLWLVGGSILCIFIGMLISPGSFPVASEWGRRQQAPISPGRVSVLHRDRVRRSVSCENTPSSAGLICASPLIAAESIGGHSSADDGDGAGVVQDKAAMVAQKLSVAQSASHDDGPSCELCHADESSDEQPNSVVLQWDDESDVAENDEDEDWDEDLDDEDLDDEDEVEEDEEDEEEAEDDDSEDEDLDEDEDDEDEEEAEFGDEEEDEDWDDEDEQKEEIV